MKYSELETPRLVLRGWRESDLEDLFAYCSEPEVGPAAGWQPHADKTVSRGVLRQFMEAGEVWAIGYALGKEHWGKGLMTEAVRAVLRYAFETLCLEMVTVYHYPFNHRSSRVIEKCGFHYEGTLRRGTTRFDGQVLDNVCYSLLREEYEALCAKEAARQ